MFIVSSSTLWYCVDNEMNAEKILVQIQHVKFLSAGDNNLGQSSAWKSKSMTHDICTVNCVFAPCQRYGPPSISLQIKTTGSVYHSGSGQQACDT